MSTPRSKLPTRTAGTARAGAGDEQPLYRAILRLAASHAGRDAQFDRQLMELKLVLRKGRPEQRRAALLDALEALQRLSREGTGAHGPLVELLGRLALPPPWDQEVATISARLGREASAHDLARHVTRAAEVINEALTEAPPAGADGLAELLGQLRLSGDFGLRVIELRRRLAAALDPGDRMALAGEVARLVGEALTERRHGALDTEALTLAEVAALVQQLLEWLALPARLGNRVAALRTQLEGNTAPDALPGVLRRLASIVNDAQRALERELGQAQEALDDIGTQLAELEQALRAAAEGQAEQLGESEALERRLIGEIDGVGASLGEYGATEALERAVNERLNAVREALGEFVQRQRERHRRSEADGSTVLGRVQALERQATALRRQLKAERARALRDPLTGLPNRLAADEQLRREFERWRRYGQPLTVAMIDIDHFKGINDRFGHAAGDKVLASVATLCRQRLRQADFIARFGGEEFMVLLPHTAMEAARAIADALRDEVAQCHFHYRDQPAPVTISIGLAEPATGETAEHLLERADRALYQAKDNGRNRVELAA